MRVHRTLRFAACAVLAGSFMVGAASANLITNGDFGTGDFTGWVNVDDSPNNFVVSGDTNILPDAIDFAVIGVGNTSGSRSIYQDFDAPTQDHWLTVSFDYGFGGLTFPGADLFEAFVNIEGFDDIELLSIASLAGPFLEIGTVNMMFEVNGASANSPNARLSFIVDEAGGFFGAGFSGAGIDNVVVTAEIHQQSVPEPETWALFGIGLIGLRYLRRRRTA